MRKSTINRVNSFLYSISAVILMGSLVIMLTFNKVDIALFINKMNSPFWDVFFKYFTQFGSFSIIGPVLLLLAFLRYRYFLVGAASSIFALVLVQIMKRLVWIDSPRPKVFFGDMPTIHFVEGVRLHTAHSFPSGHTAGAFALFFALALVVKKPLYKLGFLLIGLLVAYSRMYLSQHFLIDVTVGAVIGSISSMIAYYWFYSPSWMRKRGLESSLQLLLMAKRSNRKN